MVVTDAGHHYRHHTAAVVGKRAIGRYHLKQRNLASAQTQSQVGLQIARDAKVVVHHLHHLLGRVTLQDAGRNPVARHGKRVAQLRVRTQSVTAATWSPAAIVWLRVLKLGAARGLAILHGKRIDEGFHRRTNLARTGRHHVIFEMLEVKTAHIGLHLASARIHRHHAATQEGLHVEHRVER